MSGPDLLYLFLVSMGWLFFIVGLALRVRVLPAVIGSVTIFFSIPVLMKQGLEVPWPWLWILLPLAIDPLRWLFANRMRGSKDGA